MRLVAGTGISIVICSADVQALEQQMDAYQEPQYAALAKPFAIEAFLATLTAALSHGAGE